MDALYKPKYLKKCAELSKMVVDDKSLRKLLKKENVYTLIDVYGMARKGINGFTDESSDIQVNLRVRTFYETLNELTSDKYMKNYGDNKVDCFVSFLGGIVNPLSYKDLNRYTADC